jgi:hypothetical protein
MQLTHKHTLKEKKLKNKRCVNRQNKRKYINNKKKTLFDANYQTLSFLVILDDNTNTDYLFFLSDRDHRLSYKYLICYFFWTEF